MAIQKAHLVFWGNEFHLPVKYSDSVDSEAFAEIGQTIQRFIADSASITNASIPEVKAYIQKAAYAIGSVAPENLFECIAPHMLLVGVDEGNVLIALLCGFKFDPENDIAMIYSNESLVDVGSQDLVSWW